MKVILVGMGGFYNRGCEAIARGTVKILQQTFPGVEIAVAIGNINSAKADSKRLPDFNADIYPLVAKKRQIPSFPVRLLRRAIYELTGSAILYHYRRPLGYPGKNWDLVLAVGGDTYTGNLNFKFPHDRWLMDKKGLKVGLWGMNLGPYDTKVISTEELKKAFSRYCIITVRDDFSKKYLVKLGIDKNVFRMADPAFEMDPEPWDITPFFPSKDKLGVIGLNLSPLIARYYDRDIKKMISLAMDVAERVVAAGFGVLLVPHCFPPACPVFDDDTKILLPIFNQLKPKGLDVNMLPNNISSPQVKYAISQCKLFIAARMHSGIAGWSTGVPVISLSYSQKSLNLNDEIYGHRKYVIDIRELTSDSLVENLEVAKAETESGVKAMRQYTQNLIKTLKIRGKDLQYFWFQHRQAERRRRF